MARLPFLLYLALVAGDDTTLPETATPDTGPPSNETDNVVEGLRKQLIAGNQDYEPWENQANNENDAGTAWETSQENERMQPHEETDRVLRVRGLKIDAGYVAYRYVPTMRTATVLINTPKMTVKEQQTSQPRGGQKAARRKKRKSDKRSKMQMRSKDSLESATKEPKDAEKVLKKAMKKAAMRFVSPVNNPEAFNKPSLSKYLRNKLRQQKDLGNKGLDEQNAQQEIDAPVFEDSQQEDIQNITLLETSSLKTPSDEESPQKSFQEENSLQEGPQETCSQQDKSCKRSTSAEESSRLQVSSFQEPGKAQQNESTEQTDNKYDDWLNNDGEIDKDSQQKYDQENSTQKANCQKGDTVCDSTNANQSQNLSDDESGIQIPYSGEQTKKDDKKDDVVKKDVAETHFGYGRASHPEFPHLRSIVERAEAAAPAVDEPVSFEEPDTTQRGFLRTAIIRNIPQRSLEHVIEKVSNCIKQLDIYSPRRRHKNITIDASSSGKRRKRSSIWSTDPTNDTKTRVNRKVLMYKQKKKEEEIQYGYPLEERPTKKQKQTTIVTTTPKPRRPMNRTSTRKAPARTERPFLTLFHSLKSFKTDKQYMMFPTYNSSHIDLLKEIVLNHESGYPPFQPGAPYIPDLPFHPMEETTYNIDVQFNSPFAETTTVRMELYPSESSDPFRRPSSKMRVPPMEEVDGMPRPHPKLDWVGTENENLIM